MRDEDGDREECFSSGPDTRSGFDLQVSTVGTPGKDKGEEAFIL